MKHVSPFSVLNVVWLVGLVGWSAAEPPEARPTSAPPAAALRTAVTKAVKLLQHAAQESTVHRQCFMCHHQAMPMIAAVTAQRQGIAVDADLIKKQKEHTLKFLRKNRKRFADGKGTGGQVDTAGYALWTLEEAGHDSDETTAAVTHYLLERNKKIGYWQTTSKRPPSEVSSFATTYLAVRALKYYGVPKQKERIDERRAKTLAWAIKTPAKDTEDHVFRLQLLTYLEAPDEHVQAAGKQLLSLQRDDGGWAQTAEMKSDAYATGTALVALRHAVDLPLESPTYRRGIVFLLKTQQEDGSWHVVSRSKPFQKYFETGFPHKNDQFISSAASSWAATALALALPKE